MKTNHLLLLLAVCTHLGMHAQVTIGSNEAPLPGALLDLKQKDETKGGLGLPRVELQAYDQLQMKVNGTIYSDKTEHTGLVVYNVADESKKCDPNYPSTGLHVWDGGKWIGIAAPPYKPNQDAPGPTAVYAPNSYIVVGGNPKSIAIPVEKAFAIWDWWGGGEHPDGKLLAETSADFEPGHWIEVLWEEDEDGVTTPGTVISSIDFDRATGGLLDRTASIVVQTTGRPGNAVIAYHDVNAATHKTSLRWSWHIWVPQDDPTVTTYTHDTGKQTNTFMDRNLGASRNGVTVADREYSTGFHYQWGRKDPFPYFLKLNGDLSHVPINKQKDLQQVLSNNGDGKKTGLKHAINNPLDFIKNPFNSYDWYSTESSQWNDRWGGTKDECNNNYTYKSEMDPCPAGWKIPGFSGTTDGDSPWAKKNNTSNDAGSYGGSWSKGWMFAANDYKIGWYPAAGGHHYDGVPKFIGEHGYYWSASPGTGSTARELHTLSANVYPWYNAFRAAAFSVRCVKE